MSLKRVSQHWNEEIMEVQKEVDGVLNDGAAVTTITLTAYGFKVLSKYYPPVINERDLDTLASRLQGSGELGFTPFFDPSFVDKCCKRGIFPLTIPIGEDLYIFTPKIHMQRAVTALVKSADERNMITGFPSVSNGVGLFDVSALHLSRKLLKAPDEVHRTPCYTLFLNRKEDIVDIFTFIRAQHGDNWLCSGLRKCLVYMFTHQSEFSTRIIFTAIRRHKYVNGIPDTDIGDNITEGELVACEVGFLVGDIYTSATGGYNLSSAGTLQLALTGIVMRRAGCKIWDLGMNMEYKQNYLKCVEIERKRWLKTVKGHLRLASSIDIDFLASLSSGVAVGEIVTDISELSKESSGQTTVNPQSKAQRKKLLKAHFVLQRKGQRVSSVQKLNN